MADASVLERYFLALGQQDWPALAASLAEDVHRTGPYRDIVQGREPYAAFLERTISRLVDYELEIFRIRPVGERDFLVELSETVDLNGQRVETLELLLFELDAEGLIVKVDVYIKPASPGAS